MKKIFITGADGFIGSHLTERLVNDGFEVKALVQYNSFNSWGWLDQKKLENKTNLEVFSGDIRDLSGIETIMNGSDTVLHLASLIAIPYSYEYPQSYVDTNIIGTLNILQAAKKNKISKIIHTSTSEVYGTAQYVPIDERHPVIGQSPYSASKIGADQIALSFYHSYNSPVVILRPFNTYGPRQSARAVIPTIISQLASGNKKVKLGSIYPTRDFNFIDDIVDGFVKSILPENIYGEIINLGSNFEISIEKTFNFITKIMQLDAEIESDIDRVRPSDSEVERLYSCNKKAKKLLNWHPVYNGISGFEKGLTKTIDWFTRSKNLKKYKHSYYNK